MVLNSSETSRPLSNGRIRLKLCSLEVYIKSFGGQKGGSLEPPAYRPVNAGVHGDMIVCCHYYELLLPVG